MHETTFFARFLGLEKPWKVMRVSFVLEHEEFDVFLEHQPRTSFPCPECRWMLPVYDHAPSRRWRHLDHGPYITWLHTRLPRVFCLEHGIRRVAVPWAPPEARFTAAFERHAIDVLREADVLGAARLLRISWDEAWNLMERAVRRGQQAKKRRVIPYLGVDEKAVAKRHQYVTMVCDLDQATVEYIADDRKKTSLEAYYASLSKEQLAGIQAVAMDMWEPYISATAAQVPEGGNKIVFDRFHIMKHMNEAVDKVRKWENRLLQKEDIDLLKGSKYLWLFAEENIPETMAERFAYLREQELKTGRAWALKEALRGLWDYQRKGWAEHYWKSWYFWATHSQLKPVIQAAKTIKGHLENVLTYFDHRITNAVSEGLNSKIQTVKKTHADTVTERISKPRFSFTVEALTYIQALEWKKERNFQRNRDNSGVTTYFFTHCKPG
jgi:transposase